MINNAKTPGELVDRLTKFLGDVWPGFAGFPEALPDPDNAPRGPFFVVTSQSGAFAPNRSTGASSSHCEVVIGLQVKTDASDAGRDHFWAIHTLRDCIDALAFALYKPVNGLIFGCLPGELRWSLPVNAPRPVWQAQIIISFEIPSPVRDNGAEDDFFSLT